MAALACRAAALCTVALRQAGTAPWRGAISAVPAATLASRAHRSKRKVKADSSGYMKHPPADAPMLKTVLRQFQKKIHPDLFGQYPDLQEKNSDNFQTLMGVLNDAKSGDKDDYMQLQRHDLEFYVRTGEEGQFLRVPMVLEVKGSQSKHVIGRALSKAFAHAGLPTAWHWGKEYWNHRVFLRESKDEEE